MAFAPRPHGGRRADTTYPSDTDMGKVTGFLELQRIAEVAEPVAERVHHYREFVLTRLYESA